MFEFLILIVFVLVMAVVIAVIWQKFDDACGDRDAYRDLYQKNERTIRELERRLANVRKALDGEDKDA